MISSHGNDGLWSSFIIAVGTPPQPVLFLASTKLSDVWVTSESQSQDVYLATHNAAYKKFGGGLSNKSRSITWQGITWYANGRDQIFDKDIAKVEIEDYGSDTTRIGLASTTVTKETFNPRFLGINSRYSHPPPPQDGQVSFLESLKASDRIPSVSYAYSAGAWYRKALVLVVHPLQAKLL